MLVFDTNVWHGSVATRLGCGGMFHNDFIANLPLSLSVKEFWKSVNILQSYRQKYSGMFFDSQCSTAFTVGPLMKYSHELWMYNITFSVSVRSKQVGVDFVRSLSRWTRLATADRCDTSNLRSFKVIKVVYFAGRTIFKNSIILLFRC